MPGRSTHRCGRRSAEGGECDPDAGAVLHDVTPPGSRAAWPPLDWPEEIEQTRFRSGRNPPGAGALVDVRTDDGFHFLNLVASSAGAISRASAPVLSDWILRSLSGPS